MLEHVNLLLDGLRVDCSKQKGSFMQNNAHRKETDGANSVAIGNNIT